VLPVLSDSLLSLDRGDFAALVFLDLSAAFNTVDYDILLQRLKLALASQTLPRSGFRRSFSDRTQHVRCGATRSAAIPLVCGVLQGSFQGPVLFILHVADLAAVISQHGLSPHQYADDSDLRLVLAA